MNTFTKVAIAAALFVAPTSSFAASGQFDGDEGAFFEDRSPRVERRAASSDTVSIVAGSLTVKGASKSGQSGYLFNRADINNDGVLNRSERRSFQRLKFLRQNEN